MLSSFQRCIGFLIFYTGGIYFHSAPGKKKIFLLCVFLFHIKISLFFRLLVVILDVLSYSDWYKSGQNVQKCQRAIIKTHSKLRKKNKNGIFALTYVPDNATMSVKLEHNMTTSLMSLKKPTGENQFTLLK